MKLKTITLGELRKRLAWMKDLPDEMPVIFGNGDLSLLRAHCVTKLINGKEVEVVHFEFGELYQIGHDWESGSGGNN